MSNFLQRSCRRSRVNFQRLRILFLSSFGFSSFLHKSSGNHSESHHVLTPSSWFWFASKYRHFSHSFPRETILVSTGSFVRKPISWFCSNSLPNSNCSYGCHLGLVFPTRFRFWGSQAATELSTSDGLTVEGILANNWTILPENESDWKSHATAVAQSIHVIKRRLQWKKLIVRCTLLSAELNKPDLWDDPVHAGKVSREHGSLLGKMKEVNALEQELLEHIDMIKLAREEKDVELELVGAHFIS
ncbi:hypothetical protein L6164_004670 [Bauhinia variegata]|uniref:Uncharacterized protein n=1 Tax=Bauhinia variegata TaxID=167791 RepID=A0ACB9PQV5_BAUVA|nr:hypothetical protein L6164_004670 [Bauhinia variegata]